MKKFNLKINKKDFNVQILNIEDNIAEVDVNGVKYQVEVDKKIQQSKTPILVRSKVEPSTESDKAIAKTSGPSAPKGAGFVKSPLPGTILEIKVKVGDRVAVGDLLIVLEAMKMENNIKSDKEGIVKNIKVNIRDAVLEGDTLIEIGV